MQIDLDIVGEKIDAGIWDGLENITYPRCVSSSISDESCNCWYSYLRKYTPTSVIVAAVFPVGLKSKITMTFSAWKSVKKPANTKIYYHLLPNSDICLSWIPEKKTRAKLLLLKVSHIRVPYETLFLKSKFKGFWDRFRLNDYICKLLV